jgi:hypothetical protein
MNHSHSIINPRVNLSNKSSRSDSALGVTKFIIIIDKNLVALCRAALRLIYTMAIIALG